MSPSTNDTVRYMLEYIESTTGEFTGLEAISKSDILTIVDDIQQGTPYFIDVQNMF